MRHVDLRDLERGRSIGGLRRSAGAEERLYGRRHLARLDHGLAPGLTTVNARVQFADSVSEARAEVLRVVPPEAAAPGSFILAQDTVALTFTRGRAGSGLIPITVPRAGRIDISVDWTSFASLLVGGHGRG